MSGLTTNFSWLVPANGDPANVAADEGTFLGQIDASLGNAWTAYTPAWTAVTANPAIVNGTINGRFKKFGKWGIATGMIVAGAGTTFGTGAYRFGLPSTWTLENTAPIQMLRGIGGCYDSSTTTNYVGFMYYVSSTTIGMRTHAAAADVGTAVPVTFAVSDVISWQVLVELQ